MDVKAINSFLSSSLGEKPVPGLFPNLDILRSLPFRFERDFGLSTLPTDPGLILIRGGRQLGKSTWVEEQVLKSFTEHGPQSVFYLNGDYITNKEHLEELIVHLLGLYHENSEKPAPRLFIDEITAIKDWQIVLKRLYDAGKTRNILIITTGSHAQDLRHGTERLPGRRGRLDRTQYLFPPLSYSEFLQGTASFFGDQSINAYMICGGSPLAVNELAHVGQVPEFVYALTLEWLLGECARADRSRNTLTWLAQSLWKIGANPISVNQLARDAGVANNTVIQGYLDVLMNCLVLATAYSTNPMNMRPVPRKSAKYPWINLLAAWSFLPERPNTLAGCESLPENIKGSAWEWLVGQELWRRAAVGGAPTPEVMAFHRDQSHEIDFLCKDDLCIEVKSGATSALEFSWFHRSFPKKRLLVVSKSEFEARTIQGVTFEQFLLEKV
jgi:uncharacterized protein